MLWFSSDFFILAGQKHDSPRKSHQTPASAAAEPAPLPPFTPSSLPTRSPRSTRPLAPSSPLRSPPPLLLSSFHRHTKTSFILLNPLSSSRPLLSSSPQLIPFSQMLSPKANDAGKWQSTYTNVQLANARRTRTFSQAALVTSSIKSFFRYHIVSPTKKVFTSSYKAVEMRVRRKAQGLQPYPVEVCVRVHSVFVSEPDPLFKPPPPSILKRAKLQTQRLTGTRSATRRALHKEATADITALKAASAREDRRSLDNSGYVDLEPPPRFWPRSGV